MRSREAEPTAGFLDAATMVGETTDHFVSNGSRVSQKWCGCAAAAVAPILPAPQYSFYQLETG
jgi:hypothetical protein